MPPGLWLAQTLSWQILIPPTKTGPHSWPWPCWAKGKTFQIVPVLVIGSLDPFFERPQPRAELIGVAPVEPPRRRQSTEWVAWR
jgi:hypothetical protein